ncbi:acyl-CoA dehydrogenase [Longispora fulva]|uniref:Alkylation response protein AidB-like acyl-CoA dehydrogenase n=1 Tax=Longispora fulva TaxID=619741 RepID=A0A8J7GED0_9ACTN|nr:acyl-CoA dehydrogenase family protein [Longispora fulva]MBG6134977.1 alkylation response protein AidB-like acyl-CoA dehydrogenase [Longispora fulva]GIG56791.1 acyl-CoA dehydrogenase [Longispora fulva]
MPTSINVPTQEELVRRVRDIAPVIRATAEWSSENRRLHDDALRALTEAGVFRMRIPVRYGGYESDARTMVAVSDEIAQIDGSAAWVAVCSWVATWGLGLFPDEVQDEVFADPDVQVCTTIGPGSATAVPVDGGILVNGTWPCISGALSSRYQQIGAILLDPNGQPYPVMGPVLMSDLEITDNWHTTGFRGTGSVATTARDLFIPQERILPAPMVVNSQSASKLNAGTAMYRTPFISMGAASTVGVAIGMAKSIRDTFFERLPGRKITYTEYPSMSEAPVTHLRIAEAMMKLDEAEFHAQRLAATVDAKCASGDEWELLERGRSRADEGAAVRLVREATDTFALASGGSSAYTSVPIQRVVNDLHTFSLHAMMNPDVNAETYGRILCGADPNTYYI